MVFMVTAKKGLILVHSSKFLLNSSNEFNLEVTCSSAFNGLLVLGTNQGELLIFQLIKVNFSARPFWNCSLSNIVSTPSIYLQVYLCLFSGLHICFLCLSGSRQQSISLGDLYITRQSSKANCEVGRKDFKISRKVEK